MIVINLTDKLPKHPTKTYGKRPLFNINSIVVHHFGGNITIEEAAKLHISEPRNWPGIAYHFVIDKDGKVYQTNELATLSYHCRGNNTKSVGVALRGNYQEKLPTPEMLNSLGELLHDLQLKLPKAKIHPHRKFVKTACPGDALVQWLEKYK